MRMHANAVGFMQKSWKKICNARKAGQISTWKHKSISRQRCSCGQFMILQVVGRRRIQQNIFGASLRGAKHNSKHLIWVSLRQRNKSLTAHAHAHTRYIHTHTHVSMLLLK
jgi:hypothetical protein